MYAYTCGSKASGVNFIGGGVFSEEALLVNKTIPLVSLY
jgi:hypothetical protein